MPETVEMTDGGIFENTSSMRIIISGYYDTLEDLTAAHQTGTAGDCYKVGDDLYIWGPTVNRWIDIGRLKGETGNMGPAGAAATITIGEVATGAAGTNAKVTNAGTANAAKLNFTIPRGEKGAPGATEPEIVTGPIDFDDYINHGVYLIKDNAAHQNAPHLLSSGTYCAGYLSVIKAEGTKYPRQIYYASTTGAMDIYTRRYNNPSWSAWKKIADVDNAIMYRTPSDGIQSVKGSFWTDGTGNLNSQLPEEFASHDWALLQLGMKNGNDKVQLLVSVGTLWMRSDDNVSGSETWNQQSWKKIIGASGAAAAAAVLETARKINGVPFDGSKDITIKDDTKLPLAGGTMTGDITLSGKTRAIKYASGSQTTNVIKLYKGDANGSGVVIGGGGRTIIGGGESAESLVGDGGLGGAHNDEHMHVASDNDVFVHTNCNTVSNRKTFKFTSTGMLIFPDSQTINGGIEASGDGWIKFSNGVILQWGNVTVPSLQSKPQAVTLPTAFTKDSYALATSVALAGGAGSDYLIATVRSQKTTSFTMYVFAGGASTPTGVCVRWLAIGK